MSVGRKLGRYFTKEEWLLWSGSMAVILIAFVLFDRENYMTLAASLLGATSIIINAKGNPIGQLLMIIFSILYGIISYSFSYYGEMITYLGMTGPMALFALIAWLRHPFAGKHSEVEVNTVSVKEIGFMLGLTVLVTVSFYYVLQFFHTANLVPSTLSVTTSFIAVYLTFRRSAYLSLAYAANDIILIILWILASVENLSYLSVVICFAIFFVNDMYGFISWKRMHRKQKSRNRIMTDIE